MAFPQDPLDTKVELQVGGVWTDVTADVYHRDLIQISRGRADEANQVDPGRCTLTFNNRDGKYSPRNPLSPYYGLIGRNTPVRVSVNAGAPYLDLPGAIGDQASTPDATPLDITGDIDIRVDVQLSNWLNAPASAAFMTEILGKWTNAGGGKSWHLGIFQNRIMLQWSPDGTNVTSATSPFLAIPPSGRLALRVAMDVNNGAGGNTTAFYLAPTLAGPWTPFGELTLPGTTSIFNSTTAIQVGDASNVGYVRATGRCYGLEIRNGINGTVVANPDFTAQAIGATTFTDAAGRTWTMNGHTSISNRKPRFVGEVSSWPPKWDVSGRDVSTSVEAAGILRRLGQGASPIQSTMRREFSNPARQSIVAYWPCEDGAAATTFASAISGSPAMRITGTPNLAQFTDWAASDALPTMGTGKATGAVPTYPVTGETAARLFVQPPDSGVASTQRIITLKTTGTASSWALLVNAAGQLELQAFDGDGTVVHAGTFFSLDTFVNGQPASVGLELTQAGANVNLRVLAVGLPDNTSISDGLPLFFFSGTLNGYTVGRVTSVIIGENGGLGDTAIGHVTLANSLAAYAETSNALVAWAGETAQGRIRRLCAEEEIPLQANWYDLDTALVGPQRIDTVLSLLQSAADVDGGVLYEQREAVGLAYRPRVTSYSQPPVLELDYSVRGEVAPDLAPVEDDQQTRNDITVSRDGGGSARVTLEDGPLSVQPPPNGVGRYDDSVTLNLFSDDQAADLAAWRLWLSTQDEARYPTVAVALNAGPHLIDPATTVDIRDTLTIAHLPAWLPPDDVTLIVEGYTETIGLYDWTIVYNCNPGSPWQVAVLDDPVLGRADTDGSQLATAVTAADTLVSLASDDAPWTTDDAETPWDIIVGGEVMTLAVGGQLLNGNPFLTDNAAGWLALGSTIARVTDQIPPGGVASLRITPDGTSASGGVNALPRSAVSSITPGDLYTVMGWVYSPGGWADLRACIDWYTAADMYLSSGLGVATAVPAGQWTFLEQTLTAPAGVSRAAVRMRQGGTPPASAIWYAWGIRMVPADSQSSFSPQTFTVIRGVNGVSKAHPAGTDVRLAQPMILAL